MEQTESRSKSLSLDSKNRVLWSQKGKEISESGGENLRSSIPQILACGSDLFRLDSGNAEGTEPLAAGYPDTPA
jgi:hypothetical protein